MQKELKLILCAMTSLIVVAALCAMPVTLPNTTTTNAQTTAAQSISGKIAEVQKNSFTLVIGPSHTMSKMGQDLEPNQRTMTFDIDKNTTVDGKMQVGAKADVTYREENGKWVAINVRCS
jgi:hypothetical protein